MLLYISCLLTTSQSLTTLLFPSTLSFLYKHTTLIEPCSAPCWASGWDVNGARATALVTTPHAFETETLKTFGSEKWQWEQFALLFFRLSAPSPSKRVGFRQHSLTEWKWQSALLGQSADPLLSPPWQLPLIPVAPAPRGMALLSPVVAAL